MTLNIRQVIGRKDLKTFIFLPEKIHANHNNWVPPIYLDQWQYFNPKKNTAFSYCDTILLLAYDGSEAVGRIMGIINHRHNKIHNEKTARFAYLETQEDEQVVKALLSHIEAWARTKGMKKIIGPYGFSDQDPEGFLIQGFDHRATIITYYNFEWMPRFVENQGYSKEIDYVTYLVDVPDKIPDLFSSMYNRVLKRGNFQMIRAKNKKEALFWAKSAFSLMNESYSQSNIYGFMPMDEVEMKSLVKHYAPVIDIRFLKGVKKDNQLVGFVIGIPDMTEGIQKARGRLFPFGFRHILRARKKSKQLDLLLGAVKEEYRGLGVEIFMFVEILISARNAGMEVIDMHHQMEENKKMRAVTEKVGGKLYKRHRVYQKNL